MCAYVPAVFLSVSAFVSVQRAQSAEAMTINIDFLVISSNIVKSPYDENKGFLLVKCVWICTVLYMQSLCQ